MSAQHGELKLVDVRRSWEDFILEASFSLLPGERAALVGRSGSGKTSLLRMIAGLEKLDQGSVWIGSRDVTQLPPEKREIGMVFQDQALFPSLDVLGNVTFGLRMRGVSRAEREEQGLAWLERVGLRSRAHAPVEQLSGGERQRVAFARALIWKPRVLLLDEPFSALDRELRADLAAELLALHQAWPVPLLMVTHDEQDVSAVATCKLSIEESAGGLRRVVR